MSLRSKTPKQKILTDLAVIYISALRDDEEFFWKAYGEKLREIVSARARYNIEPDPENDYAVKKYEKQVKIAILKLHQEVQTYCSEQGLYSQL